MRVLARIAAGRRTKWLVVLAWVVLAVVFAPLGATRSASAGRCRSSGAR